MLLQSILPADAVLRLRRDHAEEQQSLWYEYERVNAASPRFAMQRIVTLEDIYPVFRELFRKQVA